MDEYLALISYVELLKFTNKHDVNIHNIYKILNRNIYIKSVILKSQVVYNFDSLSLLLLRNFIKDRLNGPLGECSIDTNVFVAILHKLDSSLMPLN